MENGKCTKYDCPDDEVLKLDGECHKCSHGEFVVDLTKHHGVYRMCTKNKCGRDEQYDLKGNCKPFACKNGQIMDSDFKCVTCQDGFWAIGKGPYKGKACTNEVCKPYQHFDDGGMCISDDCQDDELNAYMTKNGTCAPCKHGTSPIQSGPFKYKGCQNSKCGKYEYHGADGECTQDKCNNQQKLALGGICILCEDGKYLVKSGPFAGKICTNEVCSNIQYYGEGGKCTSDTCDKDSYIAIGGHCKKC